ncbi:16S rRNA (cytidine(1402)-2'-O)-methyltransferase [Synechococcales cyanobacterium C]|uniref:Ribosomal RNA small subunit methyltransferase I n=1 Tax=Petrachloros mirabilis ULC683 TaxID=2781853 RepID=A0A8K2A0F0_9CYAN|nr:16S rRNA (cytidine(1402)-2'-O)-methyltransferase [Petrachloros mirabilis]NCJ08685.1 16S rRNA (cytidine(1402)-2'-O)-methyltransferase [Petrachloros mirabilis ULC683]
MNAPEKSCTALGTLYIVGTPIGNLEDMSLRAIRILKEVHLIAAEDTRHTGKLLHHFQIATPQVSYHQHNWQARTPELMAHLQRGENLALVSDAGTPGISDPGFELVQACVEAEVTVVPIPGANAAIAALVASGLPTDRFCFEGFLPAKGKQRHTRLAALATESRTLVFYEAPHRLGQTLTDLADTLGTDRPLSVARELTKLHETLWRGTLAEAISHFQAHSPKGELTLVVAGQTMPTTPILSDAQLKTQLQVCLAQGLSRSQASRQVAHDTGAARRDLYQLTLELANLKSSAHPPPGIGGRDELQS